jgi:pyruvate ferredoxin oxidoreductase beta subunit
MHSNNETGVLQPISELANLARGAGALIHTDAAQSVGKVALRVRELDVDLLSVAGHKVYAPKGVGALYVKRGTTLAPVLLGAGQERGLRPGTENVASIVALGVACELAVKDIAVVASRMRALRDGLWGSLAAAIPALALNGHPDLRLPNTLSVRFPDRIKDVVVLAGDGATVDIGLDMTLQAWFRQEKFTTICFDNELYANTGGQESGLMQKGFVAKMAPVGKLFDKVRLPEIARESGCHYIVNCTVSKPSVVEKVIRNAVLIAREIGPTYVQLYTPCILEIGKDSMEGLQEMRDSEKPNERFAFKEYVSEPAKALLADLAAKAKEKKAAAKAVVLQEA